MGFPSNREITSSALGLPPARPWVEPRHFVYACSWHSRHFSAPAKSSSAYPAAGLMGRGSGNFATLPVNVTRPVRTSQASQPAATVTPAATSGTGPSRRRNAPGAARCAAREAEAGASAPSALDGRRGSACACRLCFFFRPICRVPLTARSRLAGTYVAGVPGATGTGRSAGNLARWEARLSFMLIDTQRTKRSLSGPRAGVLTFLVSLLLVSVLYFLVVRGSGQPRLDGLSGDSTPTTARVAGPIPPDPGAAAWTGIEPVKVRLYPQTVRPPFGTEERDVWIRGMYDDREVAFLLEFADASEDRDAAPGPDACAIMLVSDAARTARQMMGHGGR